MRIALQSVLAAALQPAPKSDAGLMKSLFRPGHRMWLGPLLALGGAGQRESLVLLRVTLHYEAHLPLAVVIPYLWQLLRGAGAGSLLSNVPENSGHVSARELCRRDIYRGHSARRNTAWIIFEVIESILWLYAMLKSTLAVNRSISAL